MFFSFLACCFAFESKTLVIFERLNSTPCKYYFFSYISNKTTTFFIVCSLWYPFMCFFQFPCYLGKNVSLLTFGRGFCYSLKVFTLLGVFGSTDLTNFSEKLPYCIVEKVFYANICRWKIHGFLCYKYYAAKAIQTTV